MCIQVLLSMGQDCLSKEEADEILYHRIHVLTSTQELRHLTRNFVKLAGELPRIGKSYLSFDGVMATSH